jgi:hypothetical protein
MDLYSLFVDGEDALDKRLIYDCLQPQHPGLWGFKKSWGAPKLIHRPPRRFRLGTGVRVIYP